MTKFLLGLGLGAMIGMMIAPASGEEMRRQLLEKAEEFQDEKLATALDKGREKSGEMAVRLGKRRSSKAPGRYWARTLSNASGIDVRKAWKA